MMDAETHLENIITLLWHNDYDEVIASMARDYCRLYSLVDDDTDIDDCDLEEVRYILGIE